MKIERKAFSSASFKTVDAAQGIAEAVVSVFGNEDSAGEIVDPGFFAKSIAARRTPDGRPKAKGVWCHDWSTPVAKTLDARELYPGDPMLPPQLANRGGLWVKAQFNLDTQRGREAFSDLQFGSIDEFSIGYSVSDDRWDKGVRHLVSGAWWEWSPVLVGMNPETALMSVKEAAQEAGKAVEMPTDGKADEGKADAEGEAKAPAARDFNTTRMVAQAEEDLWRARWDLNDALRTSISSILEDVNLDTPAKLTMIRTSVSQYGEALVAWASRALALAATGTDVDFDGLSYADEAKLALAASEGFIGRSKALAALRSQSKEGRVLSAANRERLGTLKDSLAAVLSDIEALLAATEPKAPEKQIDLAYLERRARASALLLATNTPAA